MLPIKLIGVFSKREVSLANMPGTNCCYRCI